jgi:dihydroflavonol-4-reductase
MQKYCFLSVFLKLKFKKAGKMILVTGATGLVGGNLIWFLLQENERVSAIRRTTSNLDSLRTIFSFYTSTPDEYLFRIDWMIADVLDEMSIHKAMQNVTIVYHCAAVVTLGRSEDIILNTNLIGTKNIVNAALENGVSKLCFVSSIAACGNATKGELIDESSVWRESEKRSEYSKSKYLSEQEIWKGIEHGLNAVIVNPGVILGISGTQIGSSQLFSQVMKGLKFYTGGGSGYADVQDVVKVMIQLTKSDISGERFIVVSENCSNQEVLSWMADGFGRPRPFICIGKRMLWFFGFLSEVVGNIFHFEPLIDRGTAHSATNRAYYSNQKIKKNIGFQFTPIEKSIKRICGFVSDQRLEI